VPARKKYLDDLRQRRKRWNETLILTGKGYTDWDRCQLREEKSIPVEDSYNDVALAKNKTERNFVYNLGVIGLLSLAESGNEEEKLTD
jgi:hypothetical protein